MPITWRQYHSHFGGPYSSEAKWVAKSGWAEIGGVAREAEARWAWRLEIDPVHGSGSAGTAEGAKVALEVAWFAWLMKAGLKEDDPAPQNPLPDIPMAP